MPWLSGYDECYIFSVRSHLPYEFADADDIVKYTRLKSCASFGGKHNRLEPNVALACTNEHMPQTPVRNGLTTTTEPPISHKQRGRYVMPNAPNPEGSKNTPN